MCASQKYFLRDCTEEATPPPPQNQPKPQWQQALNPVLQDIIINLLWAYDEPKGQKKEKIKVNLGIRKGGRLLIFNHTKLLQLCC